MTRDFRVYERDYQRGMTSAHTARRNPECTKHIEKKNGISEFFKKAASVYNGAVRIKRRISDGFVELTEVLADKTAREGLFGEDKDKNYCGTSVDYISD